MGDKVIEINSYKFNKNWCLINMLISDSSDNIDLSEFVIPKEGVVSDNWQTAYMEQYLNMECTEKICELFDVPNPATNPTRIVFFLYLPDDKAILQTPYGEFQIEINKKVPRNLRKIVEFEEVD